MLSVYARALVPTLIMAAAGACSSDAPSGPPTIPPEDRSGHAGIADSIFDANGNLKPSGEELLGLTLPMGLEPQPSGNPRMHRYWGSEVPVQALMRFFGPRLVTGQVDRIGSGAIYRQAIPRDARGSALKVDVGIHSSPRGGARLEIREIPPERRPVSAAEVERLQRDLQQGD